MKVLYFGSGYQVKLVESFGELAIFFKENTYSKIFVLVDEHTKLHCWPVLMPYVASFSYHLLEIPSGEQQKNLTTCAFIWNELLYNGADRHSLFLNLGGGVIGDMGGFCASTYKRGIDFIQIPTTLLSQVDASVGGKVGIDFSGVKNSIGLFKNPISVWIFPPFLKTLPVEELRSGFAEVIKHALIADKKQWERLLQIDNLNTIDWGSFIESSIQIKGKIVDEDPEEAGVRKILNFGHTIGHALESLFLDTSNSLKHGEAVAIGIIMEAYLSFVTGKISAEELEEIRSFIFRIFGQYDIQSMSFDELMALIRKDKKNKGKNILFSLLEGIGKSSYDQNCNTEHIREAVSYYNNYLPL